MSVMEILGILGAGVLFAGFALVSRERRRACGTTGCGAGACGGCGQDKGESNDDRG